MGIGPNIRKTWDGLDVSEYPPYGVGIVVYKIRDGSIYYLILRRSWKNQGDNWEWGPPGGARLPGEKIEDCMKRELYEETGLKKSAVLTEIGDKTWFVYCLQIKRGTNIILSSEHDQFMWAPLEKAIEKCSPDLIKRQIKQADEFIKAYMIKR
ncbi:MAG TPA: NUDIX domain-containing protein [Bacillota bacterium]